MTANGHVHSESLTRSTDSNLAYVSAEHTEQPTFICGSCGSK